MFAADQPAAVVQPADSDPMDVIEVIANRPDQAQKIDRRGYRVKQNPQSAQFNGIQLLRGLPAVTITPDDQIMLLGAAGVTIMVDERPVQGDPILYLRTLHGSDIERIEIMTNPSAQYSAGTGGIINIVLRKMQSDGVSGSANVDVSSRGSASGTTTIKKKKGKWTYELQADWKRGRTDRWTWHKLRSVQQVEGGPSTINLEDGHGRSSNNFAYALGKVTYDLDPRTSISANAFGGQGSNPSRSRIEYVGLTPDFEDFSERSRSDFKAAWMGVELLLDHKGKKDGETLKGSAGVYGNPRLRQPIFSEFGDNSFSTLRRRDSIFARSALDWVHPIGKDQILSVGGEVNTMRAHFGYAFESDDPLQFGPDAEDKFDVRESKLSVYATFQKRFGTWTVMPGLRFDGFRRTISSPGRPSVKPSYANLSPTVHIEHPFSKTVNMTLSYSKRFETPGPDDVRPYPVVTGPLAIEQGNPRLLEQQTAAYELNLHYSRKSLEVGLILYDRETDDLWSNTYTVNDEGMNVVIPINIGHRSDRGAQFDISSPLFKRVKGTASINLFSRRVPIDQAAGTGDDDTMFRYTANTTVEWHGKQKGKRPGDIGQVQLTYESPSREFQFRNNGFTSLSFAYTHSFSPTLSVTANLSGVGTTHYKHRLFAPLVQETYDKHEGPEFKLKLVKTLGKAN